MGNESQK
jgi:hypothetical protein